MRSKRKKKQSKRSKDAQTARYKTWRKAVLDRDKVCAICGASKLLAVHHLYPYKSFPALRYDPNNGAILCKAHHIQFHSLYGQRCTPRDFKHYVTHYKKDNYGN